MAAPIGIRLARRDGQQVLLDCTDYMITIQRNIKVIPVPFTAERVGGDINMVNTIIRMNCVIRDDDCAEINTEETSAFADIDFSSTITGFQTLSDSDQTVQLSVSRFMQGDGGVETVSTLDGAVITVYALTSLGTSQKLTLTLGTADANLSANDMTVKIDDLTDNKGSSLAARLQSKIASNSAWTTYVTATLEATPNDTGSEESKLILTNVNKGVTTGIEVSPIFTPAGANGVPNVQLFTGGAAQDCFSAGDKVQNLIASVANNHLAGASGTLFNDNSIEIGSFTASDDLIIGLQVPYNSFVDVTQGDTVTYGVPQGYAPKNFYYGTGFNNKKKDASSNNLEASVAFDSASRYTGIRGTLSNIEVNYNAGETTYNAALTFQPLDLLVGL